MLLDLSAGDRAAVLSMLTDSIAADVHRIQADVDAHDAGMVIAAAHHLQGTCGDLRVTRLRAFASQIERTPTNVVPWVVELALLAEVQTAVNVLIGEIDAWVRP